MRPRAALKGAYMHQKANEVEYILRKIHFKQMKLSIYCDDLHLLKMYTVCGVKILCFLHKKQNIPSPSCKCLGSCGTTSCTQICPVQT